MKLNLWQKVFVGMFLGILCGYLFPEYHFIAKPIATIYTNMIKMIVVPTVFFAILYGMTNISDIHMLRRIGLKSSAIYTITTLFAVTIGILFASFFQPGAGVNVLNSNIHAATNVVASKTTLVDIFINIVPTNPINAMASGNTLQVVFFAFILGISLILAGEKADNAKKVITSITSVIFKMVGLVINIAPYGVFAIMMGIVGEHGFSLIVSLGKLILVVMAAFTLQYLLFGLILLISGLNPLKFYKKTFNIQSIAFATSSSKATIIPAINDLQEKVGVSKRVSEFVVPLGAVINMDGSAIYIAACALFCAQMAGIELTWYQYVILVVTSTVGSIGAAGYPSGSIIMLGMVLASIGLTLDAIPFILAIDRFLDMFRTVINSTGDCVVTVVVDKINHTLDTKKYNQ